MPTGLILFAAIAVAAIVLFTVVIKIMAALRKVVPTNMVHIVQSRKNTTSYGTNLPAGNVYYAWPSWLPVLGVTHIVMPIANFEMLIHDYVAYDKDRVPFMLDVAAFFRIQDTNLAAARNTSYEELKSQLDVVVKGAVRTILAQHDIHEIMTQRAKFGQAFTDEVSEGLKSWGVEAVKNMELMDIRDQGDGDGPIKSIMAMKTSQIESESRSTVAKNNQAAEQAEIDATRAVDMQKQDAEEQVGKRTAEKVRIVGIADQQSAQAVQAEQAKTVAAQMEVARVTATKHAENERAAAVIKAEQDKQTAILDAEAGLEAAKRAAEGVRVEGEAKGAAEQAKLMAPVNAQIALAKEIAENAGYQTYLVSLEQVKATIAIGTAQAEALKAADIKIIANTGGTSEGIDSIGELFTPKGGSKLGAFLAGLKNTPEGAALLQAAGIGSGDTTTTKPSSGSNGRGDAASIEAKSA